jgi:hypothetical protein
MAFVMQKKFVISKDNLTKSLNISVKEKAVKESLRQETLNGIAICGCEIKPSVSFSVNISTGSMPFPGIGFKVERGEAIRCWCAIPVSRTQTYFKAVENLEECVAEYAEEVINLVQRLNRDIAIICTLLGAVHVFWNDLE